MDFTGFLQAYVCRTFRVFLVKPFGALISFRGTTNFRNSRNPKILDFKISKFQRSRILEF